MSSVPVLPRAIGAGGSMAPGPAAPGPVAAGTVTRGGAAPGSREEHTFRGNLKSTRHGWLRLTPAYSVRLVASLLEAGRSGPVLDPFCGTGTTLLSCAEHGLDGDSVDINPFLVWLARAKVSAYSEAHLAEAKRGVGRMRRAVRASPARDGWVPALHQIERWWSPATLAALSRAHRALERFAESSSPPAGDLLRIAFCQVLIARSRAHFGHQSMSFQPDDGAPAGASDAVASAEREAVERGLQEAFERVAQAAAIALPRTRRRVVQGDALRLHEVLESGHYARVITSPPYANRMSYIRELRPYMYWLRYLEEKRAAGALDWKAIGGTWGSATSNLASWRPEPSVRLPAALEPLLAGIAETSPLLSTYVRKYFHDMALHLASLARVVRRGGTAHYVVGNSKFYEVVVPVERLLAELFEANGFRRVGVETLRKRSSKKELFEYLISAERA
jgi:DNA modification methylase